MLTYILAFVVGLGSFALYMTAFFFPELHRKGDLIWSGVGMFYALVLWVCAGRITGGVLLGQMASVGLLGWFGWQTLTMRRILTPLEQRTAIPDTGEVQERLKGLTSSDSWFQVKRQATNVKDWTQAALTTLNKPKESGLEEPSTKKRQPYVPAPPDRFSPTAPTTLQGKRVRGKAARTVAETTDSNEMTAWLEDETQIQPEQEVTGVSKAEPTKVKEQAIAQAAETIAKDSSAASTTDAMQKTATSLGSIADRLQSTLKSLTTRKSKPVYVRKAYRDDAATATPTETPQTPVSNQPVSDSFMTADAAVEAEIEFEEEQPPNTDPATTSSRQPEADLDDIAIEPEVEKMADPTVSDEFTSGNPIVMEARIDTDLDDLNPPAAVDVIASSTIEVDAAPSSEDANPNPEPMISDPNESDAIVPSDDQDADITEILHQETARSDSDTEASMPVSTADQTAPDNELETKANSSERENSSQT
jgi:hypothetical protein